MQVPSYKWEWVSSDSLKENILDARQIFFELYLLCQSWSYLIRIPLCLDSIKKNIPFSNLYLFQV